MEKPAFSISSQFSGLVEFNVYQQELT